MVNTFLVHTNFHESAKLLDQRRLPNQRREAYQILNNVHRLKAMGKFLNHPIPNNPYLWYNWIRRIIKYYQQYTNQTKTYLVRIDDQWHWIPNHQTIIIGPHDLTIKLGYIYHPAVLMWLGFEDALKEYLDAHIAVTIARGIKNNMDRYTIKNAIRPPWTYDPDFIDRHRMVLLKKELDRNEPPWYQLMDTFTNKCAPSVYYWPYTPTIGNSAKIQGEDDSMRKYMCRKKIQITVNK